MVAGNTPVVTILLWYVMMLAVMFVVMLALASNPYPREEAPERLSA